MGFSLFGERNHRRFTGTKKILFLTYFCPAREYIE